jgi:ferredoxin-NADP reductase
MEREAERLLDEVLSATRVDAVAQIAQSFPLRVFPDAVGLTSDGRENLLPYGDMAFNAFGPRNAIPEHAMVRASEVSGWIMAQCRRSALSDNGLGAQVYAEADAGVITEDEAGLLVRSLLTAGLDTTIQGLAHALHAFALFPAEWRVPREDPTLIRNAFEEAIRYASPVQTFFRTTTREIDVAGQTLPEGNKVLLFLAAANRDPRRWPDPDTFSVRRSAAGHVGFGYGIHRCVGQMVARLETEVLLHALIKRVEIFELDGAPVFRLNNTLRTLEQLPLRVKLERHVSTRPKPRLLELRVACRQQQAFDVCSFDLVHPEGNLLPAFEPGAHIEVHLPSGLTRQYSICSDPNDRHRYRIAVLREATSRGGSRAMHEEIKDEHVLRASLPKNHFSLAPEARYSILLAGGIGITPLLSMAHHLWRHDAAFDLHYCAKSVGHAAFARDLESAPFSSRVRQHFSRIDGGRRLDLVSMLNAAPADAHVYVCGPRGFMESVLEAARAQAWPTQQLHSELFGAEVVHLDSDGAFEVELVRSGQVVTIPKDRTVIEVLHTNGIPVPASCEQGVCGTCLTTVLKGIPDHRDSYLTDDERRLNNQFTPCCSRSKTERLVLDL